VCKNAIFVEYKNMINKEITVHYSDLSKVEYKLKQLNIQIIKKEFADQVILS
jgi:putative IMPACT (imprinted ancient) family translation regulator